MKLLYGAIALTIVGNVLYHVAQKSIPANVNPFVSVIVTWMTSILASVLVLIAMPARDSLMNEVARLNWATYAIGLSIVAVEVGFLLVYRSGWNVSLGAVTSNTAVGVLLIPIGMTLFHERMTLTHLIGILFCLIGLVLVTR